MKIDVVGVIAEGITEGVGAEDVAGVVSEGVSTRVVAEGATEDATGVAEDMLQ